MRWHPDAGDSNHPDLGKGSQITVDLQTAARGHGTALSVEVIFRSPAYNGYFVSASWRSLWEHLRYCRTSPCSSNRTVKASLVVKPYRQNVQARLTLQMSSHGIVVRELSRGELTSRRNGSTKQGTDMLVDQLTRENALQAARPGTRPPLCAGHRRNRVAVSCQTLQPVTN